MSYFEEDTRRKSAPLFIGIFLVILSAIGATFAANISINGSNRIEFGQGVYVVEACNGWIQISLSYGETVNGDSPITSFVINGLDTRSCISTNIQFKAFALSEDPSAGQLVLYNTYAIQGGEEVGDPIPVNLFTLRIDGQENVSLVDSEGTTIPWNDPFISLDVDNTTRTYIVGFSHPVATVGQLSRITVESGPNA